MKFLRKTPWAREKVEQLYISLITDDSQQQPQKTKSAAAKEPFVWPDLNKNKNVFYIDTKKDELAFASLDPLPSFYID
ncbi:VF530 family DNA-binding protein [Paraglaciecola aquimarina]|uniref:VF530 family DNA-binding protein n=1 Tax=Paraglaciecola aquimarina TaxID=1235557 RepID=UPI003D1626D8